MKQSNILDFYLEMDRKKAIFTLASISSFSLIEIERILSLYDKINSYIQTGVQSPFYEKMKETIVVYVTSDLEKQYNALLKKSKKIMKII